MSGGDILGKRCMCFFNGDCANYDEDANHDNDDTNVNGRNSEFMILMIKQKL